MELSTSVRLQGVPVNLRYLVRPRLSVGGRVLGVCLTSLGYVVAVYVVLVLAEVGAALRSRRLP